MPMRPGERRDENTDVSDWIESTYARRLKPSDIPSPVGRSQAGWQEVRFKVQPELHTIIERLLEHPAMRGKFQTRGHVGWMLMHLGAAAVYRYLQDDWAENDDILDSAAFRLSQVQAEKARIAEREAVGNVISTTKENIKSYLDWGTPEGKYLAHKALTAAYHARKFAPNQEQYDKQMSGDFHLQINPEWNVVHDLYSRMLRGQGQDVYIELTQEYYDELDKQRQGG